MPLLRAAADEADAAEQHQLVTEAVLLPVEFGEAIENAVRHVARRREVHDVAEARLRVVHVAALLREHAEQELAATRRNLVLRLRHLLEDLRRIHIHLLLEEALADAELRIHGLGGRREAVEQRGAFRAREVVAQGLEVVVGERELRLGLLLDGDDGRVLVGDDPAAENLLGQVAGSLVVALEQAVGGPADVIGGELVLVLREERLVRLERLPRRDGVAHAEAHGGLEQRRPLELLVNVGGGETMLVAQAEQRLRRLRAQLRVHAGEAVHRRTQDEAGQLRPVQQRDLLRPRNVIVRQPVAVVRVHPDGDAVDRVREVQVLPELRLTHEQRRHPVRLHRAERGDDVGEQRGVGGLRVLDLRAGDGLQKGFAPLPRDAGGGPREVTRTRGRELDGLDGGVRILLLSEQQIAAQQLNAALLRAAIRAREVSVERGQGPVGGVGERGRDGVQRGRLRSRRLCGLQRGEQRLLRLVHFTHRRLRGPDAALQLGDPGAAGIERDHRLEFRFHAGGQAVLLGGVEGVLADVAPAVVRPVAAAGLREDVVHQRVHVLVLRRADVVARHREQVQRTGRAGILREVELAGVDDPFPLRSVIHRSNDFVAAFKAEHAAGFEELRQELLAGLARLRPLTRSARDLETRHRRLHHIVLPHALDQLAEFPRLGRKRLGREVRLECRVNRGQRRPPRDGAGEILLQRREQRVELRNRLGARVGERRLRCVGLGLRLVEHVLGGGDNLLGGFLRSGRGLRLLRVGDSLGVCGLRSLQRRVGIFIGLRRLGQADETRVSGKLDDLRAVAGLAVGVEEGTGELQGVVHFSAAQSRSREAVSNLAAR